MPISLRTAFILLFLVSSCFAQSTTQRQYLSGTDKDHTVPWQFLCDNGQNSGKWSAIAVPSNWELQGFGIYTYGYDERGSRAKPAAKAPIVHGNYKFNFTPSNDLNGKRAFLVFDGVMTDCDVKLNGQSAGDIHRGGYYRFRYDVTKLLKPGAENLLEVAVTDESSDQSVNDAERRGDFWNYAGIYRPVYLEYVPNDFIDRVAVDAKADGSLTADVFPGEGTTADTITAQLREASGNAVGSEFSAKFDVSKTTISGKIDHPKTWSAETPNLYSLDIRLMRGQAVLHQITQKIGFRTIEVRAGDGVYLNGQKIMLKGCDRHTFWPDSGRCTSPAVDLLDINMFKDMNMNAVRLSHYPTDEDFMNKCDELGIYVLDELAGWHGHYNTDIGHTLVQAMVRRDVNHPCVLFWDNGNEGGWNNDLNGDFDKWDIQNRHVLHPQQLFGDINTMHYPDLTAVKRLAAGPNVFMPTEFNHGLYDGGAGAGLKEIWDVMQNAKNSAGGFIWAYLDEAVKRTDKNGILDSNGNEAPDGIVGPYREKEASFFTIKEIWSPVQIESPMLDDKFDGTLHVTNHYDFTNLKDCKFTWEIRKPHAREDAKAGSDVVKEGQLDSPDVAPHATGEIKLPKIDYSGDWLTLALKVTDPNGRELWTYVWPRADEMLMVSSGPMGSAIDFKADDSGLLSSITLAGKNLGLRNGPRAVSGNLTSARWTYDNLSHQLRLKYTYHAGGNLAFSGITFDFPESIIKSKKWLGLGPYRVWGNRLGGGTLDVWQNDFNNGITGANWIYPEFKGYFAGVRWMSIATTEGTITIVPHNADQFIRIGTPEFPADALTTKVAFPEGGLSILDTIPNIGAKGKQPTTKPAVPDADYSGTVDFYFEANK